MKRIFSIILFVSFILSGPGLARALEPEPFGMSELPDLVIDEITVEKETCRLWVGIKNIGNAPVDDRRLRMVVILNGIVVEDKMFRFPLKPGKRTSTGFTGKGIIITKRSNVRIEIDADNDLVESNERNNVKESSVECTLYSFETPQTFTGRLDTKLMPLGPDLAVDQIVIVGNEQHKIKVRHGGTITLTPDHQFDPGRVFVFTYTVLNIKGDKTGGFKCEVFYNGKSILSHTVKSIGPAKAEIQIKQIAKFDPQPGIIKVVVDSGNLVNEPNENNNEIYFNVKYQGF